ncbi:MAG TPA: GtrA family protein [Candidatus Saccharimonadales bacterium]
MKERIMQLMSKKTGRYLIVGVGVYVLELIIIFVAQLLGASSVVAVGLGFWLGLGVSFVLQKFFAFGDKRTHHKVLLPQIIAVTALVLFNFGFTLLIAKLTTAFMPVAVSRTLALAITTGWNFYLYKTRIFAAPLVD